MKVYLLLAILLLPLVAARSGHITALTVTSENDTHGETADIYLEIKPGHGTVYIESFPLTKIDTQVSTRQANQVACQYSDVDCSQYDFFYIINVHSSVIGGPSAGGALTVLTYALLEDLPIDNTTAMTGSILSGGIIGPVGGVRGKVAAAGREGYERVLIPAWDNESGIPLGDRYNISVVRIRNLNEAIFYFTGKQLTLDKAVEPPKGYIEGMQAVSDSLCGHALVLVGSMDNNTTAQVQYDRGVNATNNKDYYSGASLCFSAALDAQTVLFQNRTADDREQILANIIKDRGTLDSALQRRQAQTIADLEITMIIHERLDDVRTRVREMDSGNPNATDLAYAYERLETARAWYTMLGKIESKQLDITPERLMTSCQVKLDEAQETVNYLSYLYPDFTVSLEDSLRSAFDAAQDQDYTLCLFKASQAKAEADSITTALYVPTDELPTVIREKLAVSENQLERNVDTFPILSYSYAEYSKTLLDAEPFSASLYAEYSLEFGSLDFYFPHKREALFVDKGMLLIFAAGAISGIALGLVLGYVLFAQKPHRPKKATIARNLPGKKR